MHGCLNQLLSGYSSAWLTGAPRYVPQLSSGHCNSTEWVLDAILHPSIHTLWHEDFLYCTQVYTHCGTKISCIAPKYTHTLWHEDFLYCTQVYTHCGMKISCIAPKYTHTVARRFLVLHPSIHTLWHEDFLYCTQVYTHCGMKISCIAPKYTHTLWHEDFLYCTQVYSHFIVWRHHFKHSTCFPLFQSVMEEVLTNLKELPNNLQYVHNVSDE